MAAPSQASPSPDSRFSYKDIGAPTLPPGMLDAIAKKVFDPAPGESLGVLGNIINGFYLLMALAYLVAREKLVAAAQEYDKQKSEQGDASSNQGDANNATPPGGTK